MSSLDLGIPSSESIVTVKALNVGPPSTRLPAAYFLEPILPGYEAMNPPIYAFYIEHRPSGEASHVRLGTAQRQ